MIHERSKKQKFEGYEKAAGKKLIRKKENKEITWCHFKLLQKMKKTVVLLGSLWDEFTKGN
jgi:hypothetical protein